MTQARRETWLLWLFALLILGAGLGLRAAVPRLNDGSSSGGLIHNVGATIGVDAQLGLVGWRELQLLTADRSAADFGFKRDAKLQFAEADAVAWQGQATLVPRWLVVAGSVLPDCVDSARARDMVNANRRHRWLLPADATEQCQ